MQLKQISRILVQFSPWTGNARSAREFLARVTSTPAFKSNPECQVESRVRTQGEPFVEVVYENKQVERIHTGELNITQIIQHVQSKAEEMDTMQKLKAAGLQDEKLVSHWGEAVGKERDVGQTVFVPRDASM